MDYLSAVYTLVVDEKERKEKKEKEKKRKRGKRERKIEKERDGNEWRGIRGKFSGGGKWKMENLGDRKEAWKRSSTGGRGWKRRDRRSLISRF